ncbi:MAG: SDR family oxidoreductase [Saprospiraceae bacterium]|nr:SDR family oxidoreductase [Saprospiraceae bacterium]
MENESAPAQPMLREGALEGNVIIVTGGGSGLGRSMSALFAALGARLVLTSRRQDVLEATADELRSETGAEVIVVPGDVRQIEDVQKTISTAHDHFGRIDALVNNAAGNFVSPTERLSHRAFEAVIGIVLNGTVNYSLEVGKYWIEHQIKGVMLNIVTTYAWTGTGYTVPSACGKAGVLALTRSLAVEWGRKYGIRANAIAPGPFPTRGAWDRLFPEPLRQKLDPAARVPLGRVGEHHELANLAAYLLSDYAGYINGEVITIDGGEWLEAAGQFSPFRHVTEEMWDMWEAMREKK